MVALTEKSIRKLIASGAGRHRDHAGPIKGLFLQTTAGHTASWLLRFERGGRERWCGLGPYPLISLKLARERAREARLKLLDNVDPIDFKRQARAASALEAAKAVSFADATKQYYESHERKWSLKHAQQWMASLDRFVLPKIGNLSVASMDVGLVLKVIEQLWSTKTETMSRTRNRIEAVLDWATARNLREGANPARWKGHLEHLLPARLEIQKPENFAAMPFVEIPQFISELRATAGVVARALELLILCGNRVAEINGAEWSEFNFAEKLWIIPANRMKARREHRIPLAPRSLEILSALPREEGVDFVFIGARRENIGDAVMRKLLRRMRGSAFTIHGFRSSFSTWASERTSFPNQIIEMALAHSVGSAVEKAYKRTDLIDKRRKLLAQWADYCGTPAAATTGTTVVSLRG